MPTIAELESGKINPRGRDALTTTFRWEDVDYPLPIDYSVAKLSGTLLRMNENYRFFQILVSGKSESGKSTLVQSIIHRTSCMQPPERRRIIKWFIGKDIFRMKEIIQELPQNREYCIVLDDQSFVLDQAKPNQKKELMEYFTVMRKDLGDEKKVKCFFFKNMHYGRAMPPALRDDYLRILTSMTDEDARNWKELFGNSSDFKLKIFQKQFGSQVQDGYFFVRKPDGTYYKYVTNCPFRIAFAKDIKGSSYPLLFAKEGCDLCAPPKKNANHSAIKTIREKQHKELEELGLLDKYPDDIVPS